MKYIKQGTKLTVLRPDGKYREYEKTEIAEEIKNLKREIAELDILNDNAKLLEWAREAYKQSGAHQGLADIRKHVTYLQGLLKRF